MSEVAHDVPDFVDVSACSGSDCFGLELHYAATMSQMASLMAVSSACQQDVVFECRLAGLSGFGAWSDRDGRRQDKFDSDGFVCGCQRNSSCR